MRLVLHPTQSAIFRTTNRFRVVVAGRRWGKTWLARAEFARWIQQAGQGRWRFWYIAPTYQEARDIFWDDAKEFFADLDLLASEPNESRLELDFKTGARLSLKGADRPDRLRGRGVKGAILDEYATMKPDTWTHAVRPALSDNVGSAMFIGTPQSYNHLHELYLRPTLLKEDGSRRYPSWSSWQFKTIDGAVEPWGPMPIAEIEDARNELDPRTFRQEYEANFESLSGRVYYAFSREANVKPVYFDPHAPAHLFFDFNIDPATAGIGQGRGDHAVVWREVYLKHLGGEATVGVARAVKQLLREVRHDGEVRIYGDATGRAGKTTGPSDHAALRAEFPGATWCIPQAQPHVKDRIAAVNSRACSGSGLRRLTVDPACPRLIADLEQVRFADNGDIDKKDNPALTHISDAAGYWMVREWPVVKRPVTVGASSWGM
jgi:hypothetical protein